MDDVVDLVRRSLAEETYEEFTDRVDAQAEELRTAIETGEFDNQAFSVGFEIEVYAINSVPEPDEEATEDEPDEAALDGDLSGGVDDNAWDGSLDGEDTGGASLEPDDSLTEDGTGSPSLDVGEDSPLAAEDDADHAVEGEPAVEAEPEADGPYMDPEAWEGRLTRLPEVVFEGEANKELGLHNAEINTEPNTFDGTGLSVQTTAVEMHTKQARQQASNQHCELVLDAMWTVPPEEGAGDYLSAHEKRDGVVLADNMRQAPRYVALDNEALQHAGGEIAFSVPGYEGAFPTILFESLATSIQPHLQIPDTVDFPDYYNAAIRTLGPLLALSTNSPFLPADFYPGDVDGEWLCANTDHELRIAAFEQSVNTSENPKVKVPRDIEAVTDVVDRVVSDDLFGPFFREWLDDSERDTLEDRIWEFDHKRGTYWRWLRCVIGGTPVEGASDEQSLRIEYRPLPTQPHVADMIGLQALTVGLIRGLVAAEHPVAELPWTDAERSFYNAAADGLAADLSWVTIHGERTTDPEVIFDEVFRYARQGLAEQDVPEAQIDEYLDPIKRRYDAGETPSSWKVDRVRANLDDGLELREAITEMQRAYFERSREHDTFAEWL